MKELTLFPARDNGLVMVNRGQVVTSSLKVAEYFGKPHKDVLKSIRTLECSACFQGRNFSPSFYFSNLHRGGRKKQPMYYLTRDGFTLLAMGFTGKVAVRFKEAYINAFNEMEELLRSSKEAEYAKQLFKKQVEEFNENIRKAIAAGKKKHGEFYGGAGAMIPYIPYYDDLCLEDNLRNAFALINNSYIDSMFFISQIYKKEEELASIKKSISKFTREIMSLDVY